MDLLRACYSTRVRPFIDSDYTEEIRYFFVDDKPVRWAPYTRFASGNYCYDRERWLGVGEVHGAPRPFSPGARPFDPPVPGLAGPEDWFRNGAPWAARGTLPRSVVGLPLPCAAGFFGLLLGGGGEFTEAIAGLLLGGGGLFGVMGAGDGGAEIDGEAVRRLIAGLGGTEIDGEVPPGVDVGDGGDDADGETYPGETVGDGGGELDGDAAQVLDAGDGGGELDGEVPPGLDIGDGGGELDGDAAQVLDAGDGGGELDGDTSELLDAGDGGGELDGDAAQVLDAGDGGGELDGDAAQVLDLGDGGGEIDGNAAQVLDAGDGGGELDGDAAQVLDLGDGGGEIDGEVAAARGAGDGGTEIDGEVAAAGGAGDGGTEIDGEVAAAGGAGDGGTEIDGEVAAESPVTPSTTCAGAPTITLGTTYNFSIVGTGSHWFKFSATNGTQYHGTWSFTGGSFPAFSGKRGTCPTPSDETYWIQSFAGCAAHTATANGTVYVWITNLSGTLNYSFTCATGPC